MRATIDTSTCFRAFLGPTSWAARVLTAWRAGRFTLVTSEPCLTELVTTLTDPDAIEKYGFDPREVAVLASEMRALAQMIAITGTPQGCRDPNDDKFIETAREGRADYLVSEDKDLIAMTTLALPVVGAAAFLLRLPPP